jgi:hypothetical protein
VLERALEDTNYQYWQEHRSEAPPEWQQDHAYGTVLHLTPSEFAEIGEQLRQLVEGYRHLDANRPGVRPVAAVARLFPLPADGERRRATPAPAPTPEPTSLPGQTARS